VANPEGFINYGPPGSTSPITRGKLNPEYLLLTNGRDDNANGWVDEGWDGVDNNGDGKIDEPAEWEQETWQGALASIGPTGSPYTIVRRLMPGIGAREVQLPSNVVIDLSRSNLPSTTTDLIVQPTGEWSPSLPYGIPSSIMLGGSWFQFWLAERADMGFFNTATPPVWVQSSPKGNWRLVSLNGRSGRYLDVDSPDLVTGLTTARQE
jgi:hypothetical protein